MKNSHILDVLKTGMPMLIVPEAFLNKKKSFLKDSLKRKMLKKKNGISGKSSPYSIVPYVG